MADRLNPDKINDAFELYLEHNGQRLDLVEIEMRRRGWHDFNKAVLKNRGRGKNFREGWIEKFGWVKALEIHLASKGQAALTSAESLLFEVEFIRKKLFHELSVSGVKNRDLVYQHKSYTDASVDILARLEKARDNYGNFIYFLQHLLKAATLISPDLAHALSESEEALIDWAEGQFTANEDSDETGL